MSSSRHQPSPSTPLFPTSPCPSAPLPASSMALQFSPTHLCPHHHHFYAPSASLPAFFPAALVLRLFVSFVRPVFSCSQTRAPPPFAPSLRLSATLVSLSACLVSATLLSLSFPPWRTGQTSSRDRQPKEGCVQFLVERGLGWRRSLVAEGWWELERAGGVSAISGVSTEGDGL